MTTSREGKNNWLSWEGVVVVLLLAVSIWLRVQHLEADPPPGLSTSSSIHTDPPLYTWFAKEYVKTGSFNPLHDERVVMFIPTAITALAVVVFKVCGVGFWQNSMVGLLYSFGALFLFFLFIRKIAGSLASILYLLMIAINYNQLLMGRLPFMEQAMIFYACLALFLITYGSGNIAFLFAGISLAIGIFFGKILGIVFVIPFLFMFLYRYYRLRQKREKIRCLFFVGGFVFVALLWYCFSYLPSVQQISGYFGDIVAMYGSPEGLQSIDDFIWKLVSFGDASKLMRRMPVVGIFTAVFICSVLIKLISPKKRHGGQDDVSFPGYLFIAGTIISFWLALMIWEYRPLRYQLVLMYPFYGAAAIILASWWRKKLPAIPEGKLPILRYIVLLPVVWVVVYKVWVAVMNVINPATYYENDKYMIAFLAVSITILVGVVRNMKRINRALYKPLMPVLVILSIAIILVRGTLAYSFWWQRPTFTARDNCRDLSMILSPRAVLAGPFAAQLVLENDIGAVVHMFGTEIVDPELFKKYPVTHLVIDEANESRARKDYPAIMDSAVQVLTYHVAMKQVRVFRIAGHTGNLTANQYQPTLFEQAVDFYNNNQPGEAQKRLVAFLEKYPENMSGYQFVAEMADNAGQMQLAEMAFKKAVEFSPTNYHLNLRIARFYEDLYKRSGEQRYDRESKKYFETALKYAPTLTEVQERSQQRKTETIGN